MFLAIYRYNTKKTGEYVKELSLSFPKLKTELKTPTGSFFIVVLFSPINENDSLFLGHIALSQLTLKIMSRNSPDKLISIL